MNAELSVNDNEFLRQFEADIEGELVKIEYAQQDRKIFLTKIVMSDSIKEKGYADVFIERVLDIIKERETRVMPTCPAIVSFMRRNRRKYKSLLPVGINI